MSNQKNYFKIQIHKLKDSRNLTQLELAKKIPLDPGNLSRVVAGKYPLSIELLNTISNALELTPKEKKSLIEAYKKSFPNKEIEKKLKKGRKKNKSYENAFLDEEILRNRYIEKLEALLNILRDPSNPLTKDLRKKVYFATNRAKRAIKK